jgi:hypothetical protein
MMWEHTHMYTLPAYADQCAEAATLGSDPKENIGSG